MTLEPSLPFRHLICLGSWPLPKLDTRAYGVHREIFGLYQEADHAACASARSLWGRGRLRLVSVYVDYQNASTMQALFWIVLFVTIGRRVALEPPFLSGPLIILCAEGTDYSHPLPRAIASRLRINFLCDSHNYFGRVVSSIMVPVAVEARQMRTGPHRHYSDLVIYSYFLQDIIPVSKQTQNAFICAFGV